MTLMINKRSNQRHLSCRGTAGAVTPCDATAAPERIFSRIAIETKMEGRLG